MTNENYKIMQTNMERLRDDVLLRVRTIQKIRAFIASPASSATLLAVFLACASIFVSFEDIIHNMMTHAEWTGRLSYTYTSILHARIVVQIFAFFVSALGLMLIVKLLSRTPLRIFRS